MNLQKIKSGVWFQAKQIVLKQEFLLFWVLIMGILVKKKLRLANLNVRDFSIFFSKLDIFECYICSIMKKKKQP